MDSLRIQLFLVVSILVVDICGRAIIKNNNAETNVKSAGIITLFFLILVQKKKKLLDKPLVLKRAFLSLLVIVFLCVANFLLLKVGPPSTNILQFGLMLAPLFIMPFFHFLYDVLNVHPLTVNTIVFGFRLRSAIALILGANVIFIAIEPSQDLISLGAHFFFAFLALLGSFYLCFFPRRKVPKHSEVLRGIEDALESLTLRYLSSILETIYYFALLYFMFIKSPAETIFARKEDFLMFVIAMLSLLFVTAIFTRLLFYKSTPLSLEFYEEKALPFSFLLFGITSIVRYFF